MNARTFLIEIKKLNFTGREFLEVIGNSKISNSAYNEIKGSSGLTFERLTELLESSPLESDDYTRLLSYANMLVRRREKSFRSHLESQNQAQIKTNSQTQNVETVHTPQVPQVPKFTKADAMNKTANITDVSDIAETAEIAETEGNLEGYSDFAGFENYEQYSQDEVVLVSQTAANKPKLIFCLCMAVLLICISFALRYYQTGSFAPPENMNSWANFDVAKTYEELSQRLITAEDYRSLTPEELLPGKNYRLADADNERVSRTLLYNESYIFNIIDNKLYVIEKNKGTMNKVAEIELAGKDLREILLHNNKLYVIFEGEYSGEYSYIESDELDEFEQAPEPTNVAFTQTATTVRVYDAWNFSEVPELEFTVDGYYNEYNSAFFYKNRLVLPTVYTPHMPISDDLAAFVPSYTLNIGNASVREQDFVAIDNIYAPPARLMNTEMTVISVIGEDDREVFAVVGGGGIVYGDGGEALYITQTADMANMGNPYNSRIIKLDVIGKTEPAYYDIKGIIPLGGLRERGGIVRVGAAENYGGKSALYVLNSELDLISRVVNIGTNETTDFFEFENNLISVLFDDSRVYFIYPESGKLYAFDTTMPDDVLTAVAPFPQIYSDDFYRISDKERLEVAVEYDDNGERSGIRLNVHKTESGETTIIATELITAESSVPGNWNRFLFTDAETDREAVLLAFDDADSFSDNLIAIPVKYSNSISNIEKFIFYEYNEFSGLAKKGEIVYYDINKERHRAILSDGFIYTFWDNFVVSVNQNDMTVVQKLEM